MLQFPPKDARGDTMYEGDWIVYTTNAEGSSLQFGNIHKISEKVWTNPRTGDLRTSHKIVVAKTDSNGNKKYRQEYDYTKREYVDTPQQQKSGSIDYRASKFLKI